REEDERVGLAPRLGRDLEGPLVNAGEVARRVELLDLDVDARLPRVRLDRLREDVALVADVAPVEDPAEPERLARGVDEDAVGVLRRVPGLREQLAGGGLVVGVAAD